MNSTNLILSVSAEIVSDEIRNFKRMMVETFGSKYGVYSHFTLLMMPCNPAKIHESMDLLIDYLKESPDLKNVSMA